MLFKLFLAVMFVMLALPVFAQSEGELELCCKRLEGRFIVEDSCPDRENITPGVCRAYFEDVRGPQILQGVTSGAAMVVGAIILGWIVYWLASKAMR